MNVPIEEKEKIFLAYVLNFKCYIKTAEHFNMSVGDIQRIVEDERARSKDDAHRQCWKIYRDYLFNYSNHESFAMDYSLSDDEAVNILAIGKAAEESGVFKDE